MPAHKMRWRPSKKSHTMRKIRACGHKIALLGFWICFGGTSTAENRMEIGLLVLTFWKK